MARQSRNDDGSVAGGAVGLASEPLFAPDAQEAPASPEADLSAMLANPALKALIDSAVAARLAQMATPAVPQGADSMDRLAGMMGRMLELTTMQQPGYQKPLPVEEVERRLSGKVEMDALLARFRQLGTAPLWTVGEGGFFECTNALEFVQGQQIRTFLPPAEDFSPDNAEAEQVHAAMMKWLGTPTPDIGDQVAQAQIDSKLPPLVTGALEPVRKSGLVEVVGEAPKVPQKLRRSMGSIIPERREVTMHERAQGPQGPMFVGEAA